MTCECDFPFSPPFSALAHTQLRGLLPPSGSWWHITREANCFAYAHSPVTMIRFITRRVFMAWLNVPPLKSGSDSGWKWQFLCKTGNIQKGLEVPNNFKSIWSMFPNNTLSHAYQWTLQKWALLLLLVAQLFRECALKKSRSQYFVMLQRAPIPLPF